MNLFIKGSVSERIHLWLAAGRKFRREVRALRRVAVRGHIEEVRFYLYDATKAESFRIW